MSTHRYASHWVTTDAQRLAIAKRIIDNGQASRFHVHDMLCWWNVAGERFGAATGPVLRRITWDQAKRIADGGDVIAIVEVCQ